MARLILPQSRSERMKTNYIVTSQNGMTPLILSTALLAMSASATTILRDYRDVIAYAETLEGHSRASWLPQGVPFIFGADSGIPAPEDFNFRYAVNSDSQGGVGGAVAYSTAYQNTLLTAESFGGALTANASADATGVHYALANTRAVFGACFTIDQPYDYSASAVGNGNLSITLLQVGGANLFSQSVIGSFAQSGQLTAGTYEFWFSARAEAVYSVGYAGNQASQTSAGNFLFTLRDHALAFSNEVPDAGATWPLLALAGALMWICKRNVARR